MKIVDVHTHLFNARYLPVEGIFKSSPIFAGMPSWLRVPLARCVVAGTRLDASLDRKNAILADMDFISLTALSQEYSDAYYKYLEEFGELIPEEIGKKDVLAALKEGHDLGYIPDVSRGGNGTKYRNLVVIAEKIVPESRRYIRWITYIVTARERTILNTLARTYQDVDVFVHHMMDMERSYDPNTRAPYYPFHGGRVNQINRMRNLERHKPRKKIITFVAWDPFRKNGLEIIQDAIDNNGAQGVKVYPPNGYRPFGNSDSNPHRHPNGPPAKTLNSRNLALFKWCVSKDVPVFTHCTRFGFEAYANAGYNCDPHYWLELLQQPGMNKLRLAFGHAGGSGWFANHDRTFEHTYAGKVLNICGSSKYPNVYCEFGILDHIRIPSQMKKLRLRLAKAFEDKPPFAKKIMYGSDWHMLYTRSEHKNFLKNYIKLFESVELKSKKELFFHENAERYLKM